MFARTQLRTARFSRQEAKLVSNYLKQNHMFESFSSLARVATLQFIEERESLGLRPIPKQTGAKRPKFLWDYDLTEFDVREILSASGLSDKKLWLIGRILSEARFEEIFEFLDLNTIAQSLPKLRLKEKIRLHWHYALERWKNHG